MGLIEETMIEKIKEIAKRKGISRYKISRLSGVSDALLMRYWGGEVQPSIGNFEKILKALNCKIEIVDLDED